MPNLKETSREILNKEDALKRLQEACSQCEMIKDLTPQKTYIFSVINGYMTEDGPPMIAVNEYEDKLYAVYAPEWLTYEQYNVFEFFMKFFFEERIVLFSKKSYDEAMKHIRKTRVVLYLC